MDRKGYYGSKTCDIADAKGSTVYGCVGEFEALIHLGSVK